MFEQLTEYLFFLKHYPPYFAHRTVRKEFINAKYVDHKYARKTCSSAARKMIDLFEAVQSRELLALIQVYAEGVELMEPLPEAGPVSLTFKGRDICWALNVEFTQSNEHIASRYF